MDNFTFLSVFAIQLMHSIADAYNGLRDPIRVKLKDSGANMHTNVHMHTWSFGHLACHNIPPPSAHLTQ